jgi:hypothetical protein
MATRTQNINLIKPDGNEALDVTNLNENFQILDNVVPAVGGFVKSGSTVKIGFDTSTYHWHLITIMTRYESAMGAWLVYFTSAGTLFFKELAKGSGITNVAQDGTFGIKFTFASGSPSDNNKQVNDISFRGAKYLGYNYD